VHRFPCSEQGHYQGPLSLNNIDDLLSKLQGKRVFSSVDLTGGYWQIRITDEDVPKTAFIAPGMGLFEFKVLCFGLSNAPATFQRVMNNIFKDLIAQRRVVVYLDDVLIMSTTPAEHARDVEVLRRLREHKLYAKLSKCEFNRPELKFLGHVVGRDGIAVDPAKVSVIKDWPVPTTVKQLQAFLGLANYFRKFVHRYSTVVAPLTSLCAQNKALAYNWSKWGAPELQSLMKALLKKYEDVFEDNPKGLPPDRGCGTHYPTGARQLTTLYTSTTDVTQ